MSKVIERVSPPLATTSSVGDGKALPETSHHHIVLIGGGTAGITVAARLRRALPAADIAIVEPSSKHYYQPMWTLVGGGEARKESTERAEATLIPAGVTWIQDSVVELLPETNRILTRDGKSIGYDWLIVAAGIQIDWDKIPGLRESLGKDGVCSNYSYEHCDKTWEFLRNFQGGTAIFTQPPAPYKCGGAPQKIAYLADDQFRRAGVRDKSRVVFASAGPGVFPVAHYAPALNAVMERKGIETLYKHNLVALRPEAKEAVFKHGDTGEEHVLRYDMIHVTPPQSAPDFLKRSPLANAAGWIEVDQYSLRSPRFPNVFSLGDCAGTPNGKTGAAIRKQAPVLVENLLASREGRELSARYNGYASCPLVTGYGKLILAEFDYEGKPQESFPFDQRKERWSMYMLKKHALPLIYWHGMLKGRF